MASIPASELVQVLPNVIDAGGNGLDLIGLILTANRRVPIGDVPSFATAGAVATYFGPSSVEADLAAVYFAGYDGSTVKPAALLFAQYAKDPVAAYVRGGRLDYTLERLKLQSGVLSLVVNGTAFTSGNIDLAPATSFTNAAGIIQSGIASTGAAVTYDSGADAFVITSGTTGDASTIAYPAGTLAPRIKVNQASGAVISLGSAAMSPGRAMSNITARTQNFASFTTAFKAVQNDMLAFAQWTAAQSQRYLYAMWDDAQAPTLSGDTVSLGYQVRQARLAGTVPIYDPANGGRVAAFLLGAIASIDFAAENGRVTMAFRSGAGLTAGVTDAATAANLLANGYNFYGSYATANDGFTFFYNGSVTGDFDWIDSYVNQIWLNANLQLALLGLLVTANSIPYNTDGYSLIEATMAGPINLAVDFGAIRAGITLSAEQVAQVNSAAGRPIAATLQERGWYALVKPTNADVRAARGSPPIVFFYCDGQSVQRIVLSSILVQ